MMPAETAAEERQGETMRLGELPSGVVCITFLAAILTSCADDGEGPLTITAHPTDQSVVEGETATFSVAATGSGTPTYQWQRDGAVIPGGTGASHTTPAATLADDGAQFTCVVTNADWSMTSNPATLRVTTLLPTILAQPSDLTVAEGRTATFVVAATGSGTLTYQWRRGGTDIPGATDASYVRGD